MKYISCISDIKRNVFGMIIRLPNDNEQEKDFGGILNDVESQVKKEDCL